MNRFPLYYTLNQKLSKTPPSSSQLKSLGQSLKTLDNDHATQALKLIYEHSLATEEITYDPADVKLPYTIAQCEEDVNIDLAQLPPDLQWILIKFVSIAQKKSTT